MTNLLESTKRIQSFEGGNLKTQITRLEKAFSGVNNTRSQLLCSDNGIDDELLDSAITLKKAVGQINVVIHAIGVLILLPKILVSREVVESLSIGAGNTGRRFDLETNLRVAEFKFISWKGGAEAIRQNSLFKDFFYLAEANTNKKRCLYVLGLEHPLKFLNGNRALSSVTSRNAKLFADLRQRHGTRFSTTSEYFNHSKNLVEIIDINQIMPSFAGSFL